MTLLAWLVVSVQLIIGPLLQRSTNIISEDVVFQETGALDMKQQLQDGWFGSIQNATTGELIGSRNGISTIQRWWKNDTIRTRDAPGYSCDGTCEGSVLGTGITYHCASTSMAPRL